MKADFLYYKPTAPPKKKAPQGVPAIEQYAFTNKKVIEGLYGNVVGGEITLILA